MRPILFVTTLALFATVAAFAANAQQAQKSGAKKDPKKCTVQACVARGEQRGYSASTASAWCSANNNGC